jgi:hypothetical protein
MTVAKVDGQIRAEPSRRSYIPYRKNLHARNNAVSEQP